MPLGIDFVQILLHFFNVVILFAGLYILLYAPVKKFMDKRQKYFEGLREDAEKAREEADREKEEYVRLREQAEEQIAAERKAAASEIEEMKRHARDEAREEARILLNDSREQAEREKKAILSGAKEDIAALIEEATRKVMQDSGDSDPYEDFVEAERSRSDG